MARSKLVKANKRIEKTVVGSYRRIEESVVGAYQKVEDKFVDSFLTRDGESVADAKARIADEQKERSNDITNTKHHL